MLRREGKLRKVLLLNSRRSDCKLLRWVRRNKFDQNMTQCLPMKSPISYVIEVEKLCE
jgi:hypothetical protein